MTGVETAVHAAYATCARITRSQARNFAYGIALLPPAKRNAMTAIYATARRIDDIGDGSLPAPRKRELLHGTAEELHRIDVEPTDAVMIALADAAARLPIPMNAFDELIEGCLADVDGRTYDTFDDLVWYCRRVAGAVGRLSVGVYDPPGIDRTWARADALGVALQLTNILRDLREDRHTGRVYLPRSELDRFGCTLSLDADGDIADPPDRFAALVRFQADRAETWYREGLTLLPMLDHRSAACTAAMAGIYRRLLHRIAADPDVVRHQRLSLAPTTKIKVAVRALTRARA